MKPAPLPAREAFADALLSARSDTRSQRCPTAASRAAGYCWAIRQEPEMNRTQWLSVWGFALGAASNPYAIAQTQPEAPEQPMVRHSAGGIAYISGGASEDDRQSMAQRQAEFPFTVKLSEPSGEFAVADRLSVLTPQGSLLIVRDAGPVVMMKLPPGPYTLEASYQGRVERRAIQVAANAQTLNWRLAG
jgi:hypothetical protein